MAFFRVGHPSQPYIPTRSKKKSGTMRLQHSCFPVNFVKFLGTSFLKKDEDEHEETTAHYIPSEQLLSLNICYELFWQPVEMDT